MSGFFGVASQKDCVMDLFFGTDYHSHLGTRRGGMAVYGKQGFNRSIHNIENSPFRTKFERDVEEFEGNIGIGCISDSEPQPLLVNSHLGSFAISTVGRINNLDELRTLCFQQGKTHFLEMSGGEVNPTEMVAALINQKESIVDGIQHAQKLIKGSMSILIMTNEGIYCARDKLGRTPVIIGRKDDAYCVTFESSAFLNLGYHHYKDLGSGEIGFIYPHGYSQKVKPNEEMKLCSFLWVYYGYPTSTYEGVNVESMRYECGKMLAKRDGDSIHPDSIAGVPDSGLAHAIGYANASGIPYSRPFIKYTPTWPRSFMPQSQGQRNLIAKMKLIPVQELINGKSLLLIDDSIVRGTQLRETTEFLYQSGAKEVHVRPACPPIMFSCKYLNFSRSTSDLDLITRRVIKDLEEDHVTDEILQEYANPDSERYKAMLDEICRRLKFTTLRYHRLDDMLESIKLDSCKLCTYCWNGKE
ncbi:MAG: amidophosphoribosyltransferase [Erysipelotrichales bacterium]|nr:amidophosphoribosyltransferase [Erysipelotrichales bacterium]